MEDSEDTVRLMRRKVAVMVAEAANNESILRRAQSRELTLLKAGSLSDLLTAMVDGLADSYGLDRVTVVLADPEHKVRHLLMGDKIEPAALGGVLFVNALKAMSPVFQRLRKPWLGPFVGAEHDVLFGGHRGLHSVAIIPLIRDAKLLGSLNFGSSDPARFTRHHGTDFLHHLAVIAGFALENAVNRAELTRSGLTDALTGWYNRRYWDTRVAEEIARARRENQPLACMMVDIDYFKRINDTHGHLAGDRALREVAARIGAQIRSNDVAARYGGEEFSVLLANGCIRDALALAERVRAAVSRPPIQVDDNNALTITVSIGVATGKPAADETDADAATYLIGAADAALYRAKDDGRDRVCVAPDRA